MTWPLIYYKFAMSFRSRDQEARTTNHKQKTQTHTTMRTNTLGRPSHYHGLPSQPSNATQQHYTLLFITTFPRALFAGSRQYQLGGLQMAQPTSTSWIADKMAQGSSRESISSIELGSYTHRIARRGIGAISNATIFNGNGQELIK